MRILVISNQISRQEIHEIDPYLKMSKMNFNIHFAILGKISNIDQKNVNGLVIHECGDIPFLWLIRLIKIIRKENINFVMNSTSSIKVLLLVFLISKIINITSMVRISSNTLETAILQEKNRFIKFLKKIIYPIVWKVSLSNADKVLVLSKSLYDLVRAKAGNTNIYIISQGIDTNLFKPINIKKEYDLLFVGRLSREKNLDILLKIFKELRKDFSNLKLCIIGDGPEKDRLIKSATNGVIFLGYVEQSKLQLYYNKSKIIILTSISEGLPTVLMEAMACGIPAVATNVGGVCEIVVDNKTGYVANLNSYSILKNKIRYLLENENVRKKMSILSIKYVQKKHSILALAKKYKKFMQRGD